MQNFRYFSVYFNDVQSIGPIAERPVMMNFAPKFVQGFIYLKDKTRFSQYLLIKIRFGIKKNIFLTILIVHFIRSDELGNINICCNCVYLILARIISFNGTQNLQRMSLF
ncbi:hypothetical protein H311_04190 [Anncaliia algerae PRA109]|nr:hypothetical protein H311_04190 [Anncaliia algerae PRA109]